MGKRFDLNYLHEDESAQILNVLEKDFQLRMQEKTRLSKIKKRINEEDRRAQLLANQKEFNENCCIRCFRRFMLLLIPRFRCYACGFNVCSRCCNFFLQFRDFVCVTCQMEKDVMAQSCDWFYETVQRKFRQSGSAKVVRRLSASYRNRGQEVPVTGRMRASVLSAFPDDAEPVPVGHSSTPEGSDVKPKARGPENSQREVLRRMKGLQISRFHERMRDAMGRIADSLAELYPRGLSSSTHRAEFRKFIHKSKDELTIILKNFSQILAITIESHNLALGRTSENVQVDIQCILQDEVEGIVSRRIDVISPKNFDESASIITDEGSRSGPTLSNVEAKLAVVILRKLLDDHRAAFGGRRVSIEEEEMLREFDCIVETGSNYSSQKRRPITARHGTGSESFLKEVDPDLLSLTHVSDIGFGRSASAPYRPRSEGSQRSLGSGSGSHWLAGGRPAASGESAFSFERGGGRVRIGDCDVDALSDFSSGEQELAAVNFDASAFSDVSGHDCGAPWAGTSTETEKKFLLQQLHQQQEEADLTDTARVTRVSRGLMVANQSVTGAAMDLETSAGQYVPASALRSTSDQGVKSAAKVLASLPVTRASDPDRAQLEEDIYTKAAEMVNVAELIEELEDCLLLTAGHPATECPQHLQRWSSIEERVVSLMTRLEGDLKDVDKIQARIGTTVQLEVAPPADSAETAAENNEPLVTQSSSNSEVAFGYRPPSRNAWEEYKMT